MKKILIASTSTVHGSGYLEYLLNVLEVHFKKADTVLFIPYARPGGISHQDYTKTVKSVFFSSFFCKFIKYYNRFPLFL